MRVNLKVPYKQKEEAKRLGARWDSARQVWYVENREDLSPFLKWMPRHLTRPHQEKSAAKEKSASPMKWWMDA